MAAISLDFIEKMTEIPKFSEKSFNCAEFSQFMVCQAEKPLREFQNSD